MEFSPLLLVILIQSLRMCLIINFECNLSKKNYQLWVLSHMYFEVEPIFWHLCNANWYAVIPEPLSISQYLWFASRQNLYFLSSYWSDNLNEYANSLVGCLLLNEFLRKFYQGIVELNLICFLYLMSISQGMWEINVWVWCWPKSLYRFTICQSQDAAQWLFDSALWGGRFNHSHCWPPRSWGLVSSGYLLRPSLLQTYFHNPCRLGVYLRCCNHFTSLPNLWHRRWQLL